MNTIGFVISKKENENRRAITPKHLSEIKHINQIYIESGYGDALGFSDYDYAQYGVNICSREEALKKDIICDPKVGDAEYLEKLKDQTIFGWLHAVQNRDITEKCIASKLTCYTWEDMHYLGRHSFWRNNEIAGEAAIIHAFQIYGVFPYNTKVAVLGRGNTARGAIKMLNYMGADVTVYDRRTESLFKEELAKYDVIVNAILWDITRQDHIIYKSDLSRMKRNSLIIDISCDRAGAIETSIPTTIEDPAYLVDSVMHYVCDHTPALFFKTTSDAISEVVCQYIDFLIEGRENEVLSKCKAIENGVILDERINIFQNR